MTLKYFAAAAAVLALAACGNEGSASLKGKSFVADNNGTPITLVFDGTEMRVNGRVVNLYNGTYEVNGNQIKFGPLATTMMAGPEQAMAAERDYFIFLDTVETYKLANNALTLKNADGREIVFQQVDEITDGEVETPMLPAHARPVISIDQVNQ